MNAVRRADGRLHFPSERAKIAVTTAIDAASDAVVTERERAIAANAGEIVSLDKLGYW